MRAFCLYSLFIIVSFLTNIDVFADSLNMQVFNTSNSGLKSNYCERGAIGCDPAGSIWVGVGGCAIYKDNQWTTYKKENGLIGDYAFSFAFEEDGIAWIGSSKGVSSYNGEKFTNYDISGDLPYYVVFTAAVDQDNVKWFGTEYGACSFDGTTWKGYKAETSGLAGNWINAIAVDRNNVKWFGTEGKGVSSFDGVTWKTFTKANSNIPSDYIYLIYVDDEGIIWFGGNRGVSGFDGNSWITYLYNDYNIMALSEVTAFAIDKKNIKWFGSPNSLARYDGITWKIYTTTDGLPNNYIRGITVDHDNNKWIGTDYGVVKVNDYALGVVQIEPIRFDIFNVPNPFNSTTTLSFSLPATDPAALAVYSLTGQRVRTLVSGTLAAGRHSFVWDGRDDAGRAVSSGVYLSRLESGGKIATGKMLLIK
jgi:ligand-binding sensor domain-containing protein